MWNWTTNIRRFIWQNIAFLWDLLKKIILFSAIIYFYLFKNTFADFHFMWYDFSTYVTPIYCFIWINLWYIFFNHNSERTWTTPSDTFHVAILDVLSLFKTTEISHPWYIIFLSRSHFHSSYSIGVRWHQSWSNCLYCGLCISSSSSCGAVLASCRLCPNGIFIWCTYRFGDL